MIPVGPARHLRWGNPFGLLWVAGMLVAGCNQEGDDLPRQPIWGTVAFEGQPLADGTIQFQPATGAEPVSAGSVIKDGRYTIDRAGGLVPGTYKVIINARSAESGAQPKDQQAGKPRPVPKELIPGKYNTKTTLTVQVKSGEEKAFDFDLKP
jgi:hypothetical protein